MIKSASIFVVVLTCSIVSKVCSAQDNPFKQMAGKQYADYSADFLKKYYDFTYLDTTGKEHFINQVKEVAQQTDRIAWKLYVEYFEWLLQSAQHVEGSDQKGHELITKALEANIPHLACLIRNNLINYYWRFKNFELALELCDNQDHQLQEFSADEIPEQITHYTQIGVIYYSFKDYANALLFLDKALKKSTNDNINNQWDKQAVLNTIGLIYRNGFHDYDRSDAYFRAILETVYLAETDEHNRHIYDGIAEGNLGRNMILRGNYEKAIPLLKNSLEKMTKAGDYCYATGPANGLVACYLEKGDLKTVEHYLDILADFFAINPTCNTALYYENLSKYFAAVGNIPLSRVYMDSTLAVIRRQEAEYTAMHILRVEQRKHLSEQRLKEEQLHAEKIKNSGYKRSLLITLVASLLIAGGLFRYLALYRKKKIAYNELVIKSQEWAQVYPAMHETDPPGEWPDNNDPFEQVNDFSFDETDFSAMKEIERLMTEDKIYTNSSLSTELIAQRIGMKPYQVSRLINHFTKKSFTSFVNEYRIKEGIRILSLASGSVSLKRLSFDIGFNNRISFYTAFKKITGLSPSDFKNSIVKR